MGAVFGNFITLRAQKGKPKKPAHLRGFNCSNANLVAERVLEEP